MTSRADGGRGTPLLEVEGLRKAFGGVRAVDGVALSLVRGEVRALIDSRRPSE